MLCDGLLSAEQDMVPEIYMHDKYLLIVSR